MHVFFYFLVLGLPANSRKVWPLRPPDYGNGMKMAKSAKCYFVPLQYGVIGFLCGEGKFYYWIESQIWLSFKSLHWFIGWLFHRAPRSLFFHDNEIVPASFDRMLSLMDCLNARSYKPWTSRIIRVASGVVSATSVSTVFPSPSMSTTRFIA